MTLYNGVDGAYPGAPLPAGTSILAAYVGEPGEPGAPDTPHIWTAAEWNIYIEAGPELRLLPIYTHNYPGDPVVCAENAVNAMLELGWLPGIGRLIAVDLETLVDAPYVYGLNQELQRLGFRLTKYGSLSYVNQNPPTSGGTWGALLTRWQPMMLPPGLVGQQWRWGQSWDFDVISEFVYDNCGRGLRKTAP